MEKKTFVFKLAARLPKDSGKWQTRDGVAVAGCTWRDSFPPDILRESRITPFTDDGVFC